MKIEQKNKKEVLELIEKHERVLAYEKIMGEEKEIRLLVIDDKLTGIIFSPNVIHFDLSKFDGVFNIRTDLYDDKKLVKIKIKDLEYIKACLDYHLINNKDENPEHAYNMTCNSIVIIDKEIEKQFNEKTNRQNNT